MLSILALYMSETFVRGGLGFDTFRTGQVYGLYVGLVYFTPLIGGMIADRLLGIRKTIIVGGLFMMAGHFLLGLILFPASGTPLFHMGDLKHPEAFFVKLERSDTPMAEYIRSNISGDTRVLLEDYSDFAGDAATAAMTLDYQQPIFDALYPAFLNEMNRIIQTELVYDEERFEGVALSPEIRAQLEAPPEGMELAKLNRELLMAAYPGEIKGKPFHFGFSPLMFFFAALGCLIIGNGCFKPNISTMLGNLYRDLPEKKDDAYNIFYMGINLGAFFSPLVAASLRSLHPIHGWHYAFGAAGIGMIISLVTFTLFQKHVRAGENVSGGNIDQAGTGKEVELTPIQARKRVMALLVIFGVVIFFWMGFHQNGLTLNFWARDNTRTTLSPELFQSVNPLFILLFTPLVVGFWNILRRRKLEPSTASKLGVGMILTAGSFAIMAFAALSGGNIGRVSVSWLISAYAVITLGELCLSPMGLSLVSKLAPWKIRGMMMGGWFAATAIGNYLSGFLGSFWDTLIHSTFFTILVGTSLFAAALLFVFLKFLNPIIKEAEEQARSAAEESA